MSYILDALKRADAERERGAVPGLHTRQVATPAVLAGPGARHRFWLAGAAALALGGVAAVGLWFWQKPADTVRLAALESAVATPAPAATLSAPAPMPALTPAPPSPAQPPAASSVSQPDAAPARAVAPTPPAATRAAPRAEPKPEQKPVAKPAPPAPTIARQAPLRSEPVARAAEPGAAAPATPTPLALARPSTAQTGPAAVPLLGDLPEDLRRQIPALAITGSVYSDNPALRLLLVNNQVLHPGAQAAPDVTLEEIRAKSSVFSYRGTRFRLAH